MDLIANYTPKKVPPQRWAIVADFVRATVAETYTDDDSLPTVRNAAGLLARLAVWVHIVHGHPLDAEHVLDHELIEMFVAHELSDLSQRTRGRSRSMLVRMARATNPVWNGPAEGPQYGYKAPLGPYTPAELALCRDWAYGQPTAHRRHACTLVLALTLGAGLRSGEIAALRVADVHDDGDAGIILRPHGYRGAGPRDVPVLAEWEDTLRAEIAGLAPDDRVFLPGRPTNSTSAVHNLLKETTPVSGFRPDTRRLRTTWIVGHIYAEVPATALVEAAGVADLKHFEKWTNSVPGRTALEVRQWLRRRPDGTTGAVDTGTGRPRLRAVN
ncbi:hypothetical protein [Corynebacterium nuruki]|uniref:hypothetical protein n=1 Tax=Corynebacterium nuruki TaxID=1032851 RepID=UPI0039BFF067